MKPKDHNLSPQRGSIFFYILLGVVLFGALAFTISRGMRTQSTSMLSQREIELAGSEMLERAQALSRAISKIRAHGISESDFCFSNPNNPPDQEIAYASVAGCGDVKARLYDPQGGGLSYLDIPKDWRADTNSSGSWVYSGSNSVLGLGDGSMTEGTSPELIAYVVGLKRDLCASINAQLGLDNIPENISVFDKNTPYAGVFLGLGEIKAEALTGRVMGCFSNSKVAGEFVFYAVLLERD